MLSLTFCDPMDYSLPGSSTHGTIEATILEQIAKFLPPEDLPDPEIKHVSSALEGGFFTTEPPWRPNNSTLQNLLPK